MRKHPLYQVVVKLALKIKSAWLLFGEALGFVTSKIILTAVYCILVVPVSLFVKKKLGINLKKRKGSYFIERRYVFKKSDLENVW